MTAGYTQFSVKAREELSRQDKPVHTIVTLMQFMIYFQLKIS